MRRRSRWFGRSLTGLLTGAVMVIGAGAAALYFPFSAESSSRSATSNIITGSTLSNLQLAQAAGKGSRETPAAENGAPTTTTTRTFGGWTVGCTEGGTLKSRVCTARFRVINKQNNSNILVWVIGFNSEGELLTEFHTLTDVSIQPGVTLALGEDEDAEKADYVECSTRGCKARMPVSSALAKRMKAATRAVITMTRIDGQEIRFQMEIPGIDQAMNELGV